MKMEKKMTQIQALSPDKMRDVLPTLIPDVALSDLLTKLHESQQAFVTLTNDYTPADLHIARVQSMMDELNRQIDARVTGIMADRKSTRLNSSHLGISYAVFCL